jgi:hypothetical protein
LPEKLTDGLFIFRGCLAFTFLFELFGLSSDNLISDNLPDSNLPDFFSTVLSLPHKLSTLSATSFYSPDTS